MMNYRTLHDAILDVVVSHLHQYESLDNGPQSFAEYTAAIHGGIVRYRNDPVFQAKAKALTYQLIEAVQGIVEQNLDT